MQSNQGQIIKIVCEKELVAELTSRDYLNVCLQSQKLKQLAEAKEYPDKGDNEILNAAQERLEFYIQGYQETMNNINQGMVGNFLDLEIKELETWFFQSFAAWWDIHSADVLTQIFGTE